MTEPTALAQLRHLYQNMVNGAVRDTASAKRIAEGLLAPAIEALERGTPSAVGGEQVAWYEYNADLDAWFLAYSHNPKAKTRPLVFGDTTPQPAQAQAGAEPLTDEQIVGVMHSIPINAAPSYHIAFARAIEAAHGIKGGQHGTE